jgi:hypothetical protein
MPASGISISGTVRPLLQGYEYGNQRVAVPAPVVLFFNEEEDAVAVQLVNAVQASSSQEIEYGLLTAAAPTGILVTSSMLLALISYSY